MTLPSLFEGDRILSNVVSSQVKVHEKFGGVVPEHIASSPGQHQLGR
jgi:tRNA A37 threonylcarbamoyltransferase TsaD